MTPEQIDDWKRKIDEMSPVECARLQRFAPAGHPVFRQGLPLYDYFQAHFKKLGGMTPEISKSLGWSSPNAYNNLCGHCGASIPSNMFLCGVCQDIEDAN